MMLADETFCLLLTAAAEEAEAFRLVPWARHTCPLFGLPHRLHMYCFLTSEEAGRPPGSTPSSSDMENPKVLAKKKQKKISPGDRNRRRAREKKRADTLVN